MFPAEASLSSVEPFMQKIHNEIRRVDATILAAVRQQSNSGTKAKDDLADATCAAEEETWDIEEEGQNNILSSSIQLFSTIEKSLKRCSVLTKNQTLFNLFKVLQRVLKAYATKLFFKLPKRGNNIVAAATGMDRQIKCGDLAEEISTIIDPR